MDANRDNESTSEAGGARTSQVPALAVEFVKSERLEVKVLFTTHDGTIAALKLASTLSAQLGRHAVVLLLYPVPYTLPLSWPAVSKEFLEQRIRALERETPSEITVRIYICRSPRRSLSRILPPRSLIVVGGRKRWWGSYEQRVARRLTRDGHEVIFVNLG
jgi:hypothetical protein